MANRETVHDAISGPVERAAEALADLPGASSEERLRTMIDGWGRGLAAGIEELAVQLDELRRSLPEGGETRDA